MGVKLKSIYDQALEGVSSGLLTKETIQDIIKKDLEAFEKKHTSVSGKDIMDPVKAYNIGKLEGKMNYLKKVLALLSKLR